MVSRRSESDLRNQRWPRRTRLVSNLDTVALLENGTDTRALTQQRFERMTLAGGDKLGRVETTGLPPGPRWPAVAQTVALLRFRHWFHPWLHQRYGDVYTIRLMPKGRPLVYFITLTDERKATVSTEHEVIQK